MRFQKILQQPHIATAVFCKGVMPAQVERLFKMAPAALLGQMALIVIFTVGLLHIVAPISDGALMVRGWFVVTALVLSLRSAVAYGYSRDVKALESPASARYWAMRYMATVFATGLCWGGAVLLLPYTPSAEYDFILIALAMALAGISVMTLGPVFQVFMAFITPLLLCISTWLLVQGTDLHFLAGIMCLLSLGYIAFTGREHSRNVAKVVTQNEDIRREHLEIIRRLALAGEYRDTDTAAHVTRVSEGSRMLAQRAGLGKEYAELICLASPMHDLGKIGIPDSILLHPGILSPEEFDAMKVHTQIGQQMLTGHSSKVMQLAEVIAYTHHERWDGSGYPVGLKGEDIPIAGRIVAICDVYDALVTRRPYKRAWSHAEALQYIKEQAGKHFDPTLALYFLEIAPYLAPVPSVPEGDTPQPSLASLAPLR